MSRGRELTITRLRLTETNRRRLAHESTSCFPHSCRGDNRAGCRKPATRLRCKRTAAGRIEYPKTRRVDHVDTYFGVKVADPYRWLEDDVRHDSEVADWVAAENKVTARYLAVDPRARDHPPPADRAVELPAVCAGPSRPAGDTT